MKLLTFLKTLNEGMMDAMIETAIPQAIALLREEMASGNVDVGDFHDMAYRYHYGEDYPVDDADLPPDAKAVIQQWMDEWTEARVHNAAQEMINGMQYNSHAHLKGIVVHRMITAGEDFPSNIANRGLGEYWSWDERAAEAHWAGDEDHEYHIVGLVDPRHVNWEQSLFQNAHPAYDHERELFIPQGSPVELYRLLKGNGDEIDPQQYGGRQQLAASLGENKVIKLRGFGPDAGGTNHLGEFMSDFEAMTEHNPLTKSGRLYGNVRLGVYPSHGSIRIGDISVAGDRGEGAGTKALKMLIGLADKHGVKLTGTAVAYADHVGKQQATERLFRWYLKNGFDGGVNAAGDYEIEYTPKNVQESNIAYGARFARYVELRESAGQYVYHATPSKNFPSIMKDGLTMFNPSLWKKAGTGERYQEEPSVYAFEHPWDAYKWAHKIEWEYKEPAVIMKLKKTDAWERDPSEDIALQLGSGKPLMSRVSIPASDIAGAKTKEQLGTPVSTGLSSDEFEQHVVDELS